MKMFKSWGNNHNSRLLPALLLSTLLLFAVFLFSLNSGLISLSPSEVIHTLLGFGSTDSKIVLFDIRLPRIVIAMLVGAGFALSGAIMQGVSQNALADPGILGINAGAGLAVVLYIAYFYEKIQYAPVFALPIIAFLGAAAAALIVFALAYKNGRISPIRLILVGIAAGAGFNAVMLFLTYRMNAYSYDFVKIWMSGSVWGTNWQYVLASVIWLALLTPHAIYKAHRINMLNLGDELSTGLGVAVLKERIIVMAIAVGLAGSCTAVAGSIGFIGLIAPHVARKWVGVNYKRVLPTSALLGAILVLLADTIGRIIVQPVEIPVGIVTAAIGAPYFLYLLIRKA
ncbi:Iron-uptake system permease protein FeuC [compost metagenome]